MQAELTTALKRVATNIFDRGGIIRKLENLGTRSTPYKISSHSQVHRQASLVIATNCKNETINFTEFLGIFLLK